MLWVSGAVTTRSQRKWGEFMLCAASFPNDQLTRNSKPPPGAGVPTGAMEMAGGWSDAQKGDRQASSQRPADISNLGFGVSASAKTKPPHLWAFGCLGRDGAARCGFPYGGYSAQEAYLIRAIQNQKPRRTGDGPTGESKVVGFIGTIAGLLSRQCLPPISKPRISVLTSELIEQG
jgi:hypothetical protein